MDVVTGDCCEGWGVSGWLWTVSVVKGGCSDEVKCDFVIGEGCNVWYGEVWTLIGEGACYHFVSCDW